MCSLTQGSPAPLAAGEPRRPMQVWAAAWAGTVTHATDVSACAITLTSRDTDIYGVVK